MNIAYHFGSWQVFHFTFIHVKYLIAHFQIVSVRRWSIQFDFIIATFDHNDYISIKLDHLLQNQSQEKTKEIEDEIHSKIIQKFFYIFIFVCRCVLFARTNFSPHFSISIILIFSFRQIFAIILYIDVCYRCRVSMNSGAVEIELKLIRS